MSFLSGLFGGSDSTQTNSSSSGYNGIPQAIQSGFNGLGTSVSQYTNPNNPGVTQAFTPIPQTASETQGYNAINQGFTPTQASLNSDLSMLMNPFNDSVIGGINNQANSQYSILKQNADANGQFGSNRQNLGANDIELQRQNQIGSLLQNQYNTALGQVFNNLVPQRQQDAYNQVNEGANQRALALQTSLAPVTALQAGTSMIAPFQGSTSTGYGSTSSNGSAVGQIGQLGGAAAGLGMMFSDRRLKKNIKYLGIEKNHKIYEFKYSDNENEKYIGVMAQEVINKYPDAVTNIAGHLAVNYDKIGIEFRRAA